MSGTFDPPNDLVVRRHDSEANAHTNLRPRLPIYNAIPFAYGALSEQLQLFWSNAFKGRFFRLLSRQCCERVRSTNGNAI